MLVPSEEAKEFMDFQKNFDPNQKGIIEKDDDWYYNDQTHVTNSQLKHLIDGGPQHLKAYYDKKIGLDKPEYIFGRAQHCLLFEPEAFNSRFYSIDDEEICIEASGANWKAENKSPRATKIYKEWIAAILASNTNRQLLSFDDFTSINNMIDKLLSYKQVREMIESCTKREAIYSNELLGVKTKCKVDAINPGNFIVDYKSTKDPATIHKFKNVVRNYHYDRQGAFYGDITKTKPFWFIVQEKTYPHTVCLAELSGESRDEGTVKYQYGLEMYKNHFVNKKSEIDNYFEVGSI